MSEDLYHITEPLTMTANGPLWRGYDTSGDPCLVRFISAAVARKYRSRLDTLMAIKEPHLMQVRQVIDEGERTAVICEHIEGIPLSHLIAEPGAITPRQAEQIVGDIARGLSVLHDHGIAHGDVSSANVIVGERAVLIDLIDEGEGTEPYRAPERLADVELDEDDMCRCDVWAWGCIAEELGVSDPLVERALANDPLVRPSMAEVPVSFDGDRDAPGALAMSSTREMAANRLLRREAERDRTQHRSSRARHKRRQTARGRVALAGMLLVIAVSAWWVGDFALPGSWESAHAQRKGLGAGLIPVNTHERVAATARADDRGGAFDVNDRSVQSMETTYDSKRTCPSNTEAASIIADLTSRRAEAVMERDSAGLATIYESNSTNFEADQTLIETLHSNNVEIRDFSTGIADVKVTGCADLISVEATMSQSEYTRCRSGVCAQIAADEPRPTQFNLSGPPWRVVTVHELSGKNDEQS